MPDLAGQTFTPVMIEEPPSLSLSPMSLVDFVPGCCLTRDHLNIILSPLSPDFLLLREIDLLVAVLLAHEDAFAFDNSECGIFSDKFYPDYDIPVIEHTPWVQSLICISKAIKETICNMLRTQIQAGKYEFSSTSYRSRIFAVIKKNGIRLIQDVQELNHVTVRDSGLPPGIDDFAEDFVGHVIYGLFDLFSGYDGRRLAVQSRHLTTFSSLVRPLHNCILPQGVTNVVIEFQHCTTHMLQDEILSNRNVFIDDIGIKGPKSRYDDVEITPGIRKFVYKYATTSVQKSNSKVGVKPNFNQK